MQSKACETKHLFVDAVATMDWALGFLKAG